MAPVKKFQICYYLAILALATGLYFLTLALSVWFGVLIGTGLKRDLNGVAGALILLGLIQPTLVRRCFIHKRGTLTNFAHWLLATFKIGEDELVGAISFPWWLALILGLVGFLVNLFLKSPQVGT